MLYEFSVGTIIWLYMAEILQDKAIGIATCGNMVISLLVSIAIPPILTKIKTPENDNIGWVFIFFGIVTALGLVFDFIFMNETKDKTPI